MHSLLDYYEDIIDRVAFDTAKLGMSVIVFTC